MIENLINYMKTDEFLIGIYENSVHIFNYKRIIDISEDKINILVKSKSIEIKGHKLLIKKLDKDEILVSGDIKRIDLIEK